MKMFDYEKYRYYTSGNKVIAISTYAGKTVRGTAKCDPNDAFDLEKGKRLAAARCAAKISTKRLRRAEMKCSEANDALHRAEIFSENMNRYFSDALMACEDAQNELKALLGQM